MNYDDREACTAIRDLNRAPSIVEQIEHDLLEIATDALSGDDEDVTPVAKETCIVVARMLGSCCPATAKVTVFSAIGGASIVIDEIDHMRRVVIEVGSSGQIHLKRVDFLGCETLQATEDALKRSISWMMRAGEES